jgi:hypothetical protein
MDFALGVRHLKLDAIVSRLGIEQSFPAEFDHFSSTSFNCIRHLVPSTDAASGHWQVDLSRSGRDYVSTVLPALYAVSTAFFTKFADLRAAREELLRHDGFLFTGNTWGMVAIVDLALGDCAHLRQFAAAEMHGWGLERDEGLWQRIRHEFPEVAISEIA